MNRTPTLLYGPRTGALLAGAQGTGTPALQGGIPMRVRSHRLAPDGPGGECVFEAVILALRHQAPQSVTLRAFVDDALVQTSVLALPAQPAVRTRTLEVRLSVPVVVDAVERARVRPRGAWIQVELESTGTQPLAVDGCDIEFTAVRRR